MRINGLIGSVRKNARESLQVHVQEYRGAIYVDARVWFQDPGGNPPTLIATKKGLCLRPELVKELLPLLAEATAKAETLDPNDLDKGGE